MIATVAIWAAFAVTAAFGLCKMHFGQGRDFILALALVCVTAVVATMVVWRGAAARLGLSAAPGGFPVVNATAIDAPAA